MGHMLPWSIQDVEQSWAQARARILAQPSQGLLFQGLSGQFKLEVGWYRVGPGPGPSPFPWDICQPGSPGASAMPSPYRAQLQHGEG